MRAVAVPLGLGILPGESSLNWPIGLSPTDILGQILSGNYSAFGVPTLGQLMNNAWVMDVGPMDGLGIPNLNVLRPIGEWWNGITNCYDESHKGKLGKSVRFLSLYSVTSIDKNRAKNLKEAAKWIPIKVLVEQAVAKVYAPVQTAMLGIGAAGSGLANATDFAITGVCSIESSASQQVGGPQ